LTGLSKAAFWHGKNVRPGLHLAYDNFLGRMAIARIYSGRILSGSQIFIKGEMELAEGKIAKLFSFEGIIGRKLRPPIPATSFSWPGFRIFISENYMRRRRYRALAPDCD